MSLTRTACLLSMPILTPPHYTRRYTEPSSSMALVLLPTCHTSSAPSLSRRSIYSTRDTPPPRCTRLHLYWSKLRPSTSIASPHDTCIHAPEASLARRRCGQIEVCGLTHQRQRCKRDIKSSAGCCGFSRRRLAISKRKLRDQGGRARCLYGRWETDVALLSFVGRTLVKKWSSGCNAGRDIHDNEILRGSRSHV